MPLSPCTSTLASLAATLAMSVRTRCIDGESPSRLVTSASDSSSSRGHSFSRCNRATSLRDGSEARTLSEARRHGVETKRLLDEVVGAQPHCIDGNGDRPKARHRNDSGLAS